MAIQRVDLVNELYIPFLSTIQIYADENGELYRINNDTTKPCELSGKRLILPTEQNLQRANDAEHIFFHPLSENIAVPRANYTEMSYFWTAAESFGNELRDGIMTHENAAEKLKTLEESSNTSGVN